MKQVRSTLSLTFPQIVHYFLEEGGKTIYPTIFSEFVDCHLLEGGVVIDSRLLVLGHDGTWSGTRLELAPLMSFYKSEEQNIENIQRP